MNGDTEIPDSAFEKAMMLQNMIIALGTGSAMDDRTYKSIRSEFMSDPITKGLLPSFVRTCRDSGGMWGYLKSVHSGSGAYAERRHHVNQAFNPLLEHLEEGNTVPLDAEVTSTLQSYNEHGVQSAWIRALKRRDLDPEGAITAARTLLEEVCCHILEDFGETETGSWDLPKLYKMTSKRLQLAPSQHTEDVFKRILGGCNSVVEGLGSLRNKISDAHGQGRRPVRPAPRHASLAVNLAGSMAMFLIQTWLDKTGNNE